jgi:hypothetical protein
VLVNSTASSLPDVTTFAANVVVFLAAVAATVVGAMTAVKKIKESILENNKPIEVTNTQVIGGLLQDAVGSAMMAEQLRHNQKAQEDLCDELKEVRIVLNRIADLLSRHG